jgi:ribulose-5-phosphate 4-epimerase/fuculose-1-phosphate aldolase
MTNLLPDITDAEWRTRVDLAACYRLIAKNGWDDLIYTHVSAHVPDTSDQYLINPFGLTFNEVTASNLVKVNIRGEIVGESRYPVNPTGFTIHGAVHAARPDARCVMHLHTNAGIAVSMLACGLLPVSQHAMRFYRNIAYHDYEGVALSDVERVRLTANLGRHKAMILRNHGVLTCGATVGEAYVLMATLDKACVTQLAAMAASHELVIPPESVLEKSVAQLIDDTTPEGELEWPALIRQLEREDPSFKT